jgi:hypothetical protein
VEVEDPASGYGPRVRVPEDEAVVERAVIGLLDPHPPRWTGDQRTLLFRHEDDVPAFVANGPGDSLPRNRGPSLRHDPPFPHHPIMIATTVSKCGP